MLDDILIFSIVGAPFMGAFAIGGAICDYISDRENKKLDKVNRHKNDLNSILYSLMISDLYDKLNLEEQL